MGGSLSATNSTIVSAFQSTLLHQFLIVLALMAALAIAWNALRAAQLRQAIAHHEAADATATSVTDVHTPPVAEPPARRLLRIGFGLIWIFDGILQAQSAMPAGLATQAIQPGAATSPSWVQTFVNSGVTIWNDHPITAAVAAVWVQVGIGIWLIVAARGRWSRAGGIVSLGWGLVVWSFGEAFGGIFAPGLTILFGAPGAVLFYCLAGGLVALPLRAWSTRTLGRIVLGGLGAFFVGMAVLQAWPGRGFWQGAAHHGTSGTLLAMINSMAATSQPAVLANWVRAFGAFDGAHGFAVNLVAVVVLALIGLAFCSLRPRVVRAGLILATVFCLADWILIEDFGFFGGIGTDPNSMLPILLCAIAGYLAFVSPTSVPAVIGADKPRQSFRQLARLEPSYAFRTLAAGAAAIVVVLGAAPMAFASTNPTADAIVTEATNGTPQATNAPAPPFSLVNQHGQPVSLASLRGKTIALTFLDPVCLNDCPIIGQEFHEADVALGSAASKTEFVAIVANPLYRSTFYLNAFDTEEHLSSTRNWLYLTGSVSALEQVWDDYGVQVTVSPAGAMVDHSDLAYVIDAGGKERYILSAGPGAGTSSTESSFSGLLDSEITTVLANR
jgi:cytochrome oxidase Cu insertion factor (SCO1/SenC/PrrC family)